MKLRIMRKEIDVDSSRILFNEPVVAENFARNWQVYGGEWRVEDGWLTGRNPDNCPGMVFLRGDYPGNVLLEFEGQTVLPSTHDIDFMWNGSWDDAKQQRGMAYVGGLEGWWEGKVGLEKSPDYKLYAVTPLFNFQPGRTYLIQAGSINGHCFIFVDGQLLIEMVDPDPIDSHRFTKVGFEAYCSHIQVRNVCVRQIAWRADERTYRPEF